MINLTELETTFGYRFASLSSSDFWCLATYIALTDTEFQNFCNRKFNHMFKKIILSFYWSIVDLQCCVSFRCTAEWFSYIYTYMYMHISEKAMAPHSSNLAWKILWTEEPIRLQSMGPLRVGHDWATSLSLFTFMHWRRKWQPTPVFLPGESQGQWSLVGCHLWGHTESETTEVT